MQFERIEVETRDEYRGAQAPVSFRWRGRHFAVAQIVDRWYEGFIDARRMPLRYYKVRCRGGEEFILRYHERFCAWSLRTPAQEPED